MMSPPERTARHFQTELEQLKARLLEMGGLAEEQVRRAIRGLVDRDRDAIERVIAGDGAINALHIEIDDRCFTLLALYQPMAVDLVVEPDHLVGEFFVGARQGVQRRAERAQYEVAFLLE